MSNYLNNLNIGQTVKNMNTSECKALASEIRGFLIKSIAETGGHLASNLGVVELTIALYKVFDFPTDKLVWDVGHQSYVHKLLSGRRDGFKTLRQFGGMSGFPKTAESEYDSFNTGHSSTSVSAALGMARARDLCGGKENVIAVFGDGALTGGMLYEALNDAGHKNTRLILILNDNAMSISKNVGAISKYLRNLRSKPGYYKAKKRTEKFLSTNRLCGNAITSIIRHIKKFIRNMVVPPTIFDDLGFEYIGPIDGHNINALVKALNTAKEAQNPILLHIHTKKGKGYAPAEQDPQYFHGVSHFDADAENVIKPSKKDYSSAMGCKLCDIAEKNKKVVAITAAMPIGTGLGDFSAKFKHRFFDVGIAEQHAVTFAAGMAISGCVPVVALYSSFAQRAYDQILHDVCLQNLHVVFCIDRAGIVGADGETHHGLYDIAYLSHMPNMTILSPSNFSELEQMLEYAVNTHNGPIAIRYPRGNEEFTSVPNFEYGKANVIENGTDITLISSGRMMATAEKISNILKEKNISAELLELATIVPLDIDTISASLNKTKLLAVLEDHTETGGIADIVAARVDKSVIKLAFPRKPITHGQTAELDRLCGLDAEAAADKICKCIEEKIK